MKILLTGGSGMVGRNLMEHPSYSKYTFISPSRSVLDLSDLNKVRKFMRTERPDLVIHAAGTVGGIQANKSNPAKFLYENINVGCNVVLAASECAISRLLNIGSSCMYPKDIDQPITEDFILGGPLEPTNEGYALAKIAVQRLCSYVTMENSELHYRTLIPCNLFGRHDNYSPASSHLIAAAIHKLHQAKIANSDKVVIWGDGSARREFLFATEFSNAIYAAIENFERLPPLMNIGVGKDYTITEYYEMAAKVVGWHGRFLYDLSKPSGMKRKLLDVSKQKQFGWEPKIELAAALDETYKAYLQTSNV